MGSDFVLLAYVGPEVALPVASVLATVVGFLMMVGRAPFRFAARALRIAPRNAPPVAKADDARPRQPPIAP